MIKMNRYYRHAHGCGSGYVDALLKIEPENKVMIDLSYGWMGDEKLRYTLSSTLLPVSGPYHIIRVESFNDTESEHKLDAYFDTYIFNEVLDTEWFKYPMDDVPIGLYIGNGCRSTEKFQLQMFKNETVVSQIPKHTKLNKVVKILNGLKYESIDEEKYHEWLTLISKRIQ